MITRVRALSLGGYNPGSKMRQLLALIVLAALLAGGYYYWKVAPRPPRDLSELGQRLDDVRLSASVKTALALNRRLAGANVELSIEDAVLTLRGSVTDGSVVRLAEQIAAAVPGVRRVVNQLSADAPAQTSTPNDERTLGERVDDEALQAKIRLAFALNRELQKAPVAVRVYRRRVILSGDVDSPAQRQRALQVAGDVPDVNGVTDGLRAASPAH
jgi:hyperosmotically inducible periplasmic protein